MNHLTRWAGGLALSVILWSCALVSGAHAQVWSKHVVTGYMDGWAPAVGFEVEGRKPLGKAPDLPSGDGVVDQDKRKLMLSWVVSEGITWSRSTGVDPPTVTGGAMLGIMHPCSSQGRVGIYAIGNMSPHGLGAAARVEPFEPIAFHLGLVHLTRRHRNVAYGGVEVSVALVSDLLRGQWMRARELFHGSD